MQSIIKQSRRVFSTGNDPSIPSRITNLENNVYKITYYEIVSGTSGSISVPSGATINQGEFGLSGNAILSKIDGSNKVTYQSPLTSGGAAVTATLNTSTGAWLTSGVYTDTSVALIYSINIKGIDYQNLNNAFIIETVSLGGTGSGTGDMLKSVYDVDNTGVVDNAEAIKIIGRNSTGATLRKGTIIYINGSTGNRPNFVKAQANSEATSAGTFGVIADDLSNNSDGYALCLGYLDNLDTRTTATYPFTSDTLVDGDTIYLSPTTAGYITNVKPSAPNHLVYLGKVTRTSPTNGTIVYRVQNGYELDELHDVQDVSYSTPIDADSLLIKDNTNSLWKRLTFANLKTYLTGLYVDLTTNQTVAGKKTFTDLINIGNASNTNQSQLRIGQGTAIIDIGNVTGGTGLAMIHLNMAIPNTNNYAMMHDGSSTYVNSSNSNPLYFSFNNNIQQTLASGVITFTPITRTSGAITPFTFTVPPNTNQTVSTNIPNFKVTGNTKQWATGTLPTQYFNYFSANTIAFIGASTATDVYTIYVDSTIAGTNATITNNYALGVNGKSNFLDAVKLNAETASRVLYLDASKNVKSSTVTDTTLGYLDATSSIQTQLNGKLSTTITSVAKGDTVEYNGSAWVNVGIQYTVELIDALTIDIYAPYDLKINSVTNILNSPTTTILVGGSAYTLGNTITTGSKITITVSVAAVVTLNINKV